MAERDPITNQAYPPEAIQRVTHITAKVHVYQIPPMTSNKGYAAASWTQKDPIFTARLRVMETSIPPRNEGEKEKVITNILLEDPKTGELFAGSPYNQPTAVQQATDSSRFFAIRVVGEGNMKATLGMGFEDRSDAFDFGVALQDAGKALGFTEAKHAGSAKGGTPKSEPPPDYSLKEGEMIHINIGGKGKRTTGQDGAPQPAPSSNESIPFLPPPPTTKSERRKSAEMRLPAQPVPPQQPSAKDLGFDDGEFGEFQ